MCWGGSMCRASSVCGASSMCRDSSTCRAGPVLILPAQRGGPGRVPEPQPAGCPRPPAVPGAAQLRLSPVRGHTGPGPHAPLLPPHAPRLHFRLLPPGVCQERREEAGEHQDVAKRWRILCHHTGTGNVWYAGDATADVAHPSLGSSQGGIPIRNLVRESELPKGGNQETGDR